MRSGGGWWLGASASVTMLGAASLTAILVGSTAPAFGPEVGVSDHELGIAASGFWLAAAASAWAVAPRAARWGWRRTAAAGMACIAVGQLGLAVGLRDAWSLSVLLAVVGLAYGVVVPTSNVALAEEVPARRHGLLLGVKQGAAPAAGILAGALVPVAVTVGWRWAFAGAATLTILALLNTLAVRGGRGGAEQSEVDGRRRPARVRRIALLVAAGAGLATMSIAVISAYSARTLVAAGLDLQQAGVVVLVASVASLATRLVSGWLADRRGADGLAPAAALILAGGVGMVLLATGERAVVVPAAILTFAAGWGWPALVLLGVLRHAREATAYVASRFQIGTGIGGACGPAAFGFLASHHGLATGWLVAAVTAVPAAGFVLALGAVTRRGERAAV
jgi:MFS family permease